MSCNEVSNRCGKVTNSACTVYEGTLPSSTGINPNSCDISVEQVLQDMAIILTKINDEINFDSIKQGNLGNSCFTYLNLSSSFAVSPETSTQYVSIREAVKTLENKLIQVMEFIGMACPTCNTCDDCPPIYDQSISCLGLNIPGPGNCNTTPATLKQLLQYILDKLP